MAPDTAALMVPQLIMEPKPHFVSTLPDGTRIGWDTCGTCLLHIAVCSHDIPVEPRYIEAMRTGQPAQASYLPTAVSSAETSRDRYQISAIGGSSRISISDLVDDELVAKVKAAKEAHDA